MIIHAIDTAATEQIVIVVSNRSTFSSRGTGELDALADLLAIDERIDSLRRVTRQLEAVTAAAALVPYRRDRRRADPRPETARENLALPRGRGDRRPELHLRPRERLAGWRPLKERARAWR